MALGARSIVLLTVGIAVGATGFGLGAFLASDRIGWTSSLLYSIAGVAGAPLAALSWTSRRSVRCQILAGIACLLGLVTGIVLLFEITHEFSAIAQVWSQAPLAVAFWFVLGLGWGAAALARLIWFQPPHTRGRLSSRRGDAGL